MLQPNETLHDQWLGFTLPHRHARGRCVRLSAPLNAILHAHGYPPAIRHLLSEALVLTCVMGALLKGENAQLTIQAQTRTGPVKLMVCDYRGGALRGYVDYDAGALEGLGANPVLSALFGEGFLAITFETEEGQRYQGIVPLDGASLAQACEAYFFQSEQIPTLLRVAIEVSEAGAVAGGFLLQHLAEGEEGRERLHVRHDHPDWEHVHALAATLSHQELVDPELSMEELVWRLFHEEAEIRTTKGGRLTKGCRCTAERYEELIARFPNDEKDAMRNEAGVIVVDCAFCSREFALSA